MEQDFPRLAGSNQGMHSDGTPILQLIDSDGAEFIVKAELEALRLLTADLIKFITKLDAQRALSKVPQRSGTPPPAQTLPLTATALLVAKDVRLVRWKSDGALLHATTTVGAGVQLAMLPHHVRGLRTALNSELPEE
jgi:hypothetical protein